MPVPLIRFPLPAFPRVRVVGALALEIAPSEEHSEAPTRLGRFAQTFALLSDVLGMDAASREAQRVLQLSARGSR
jgi:hypothetical protein